MRGDPVAHTAMPRLEGVVVDERALSPVDRPPGGLGELVEGNQQSQGDGRLSTSRRHLQVTLALLPQTDCHPCVAARVQDDPGQLVEDLDRGQRLGERCDRLRQQHSFLQLLL